MNRILLFLLLSGLVLLCSECDKDRNTEDELIPFTAQYSVSFGICGMEHPLITVIESQEELTYFYNRYKDCHDLDSSFSSVNGQYSDAYFEHQFLAAVLLPETSSMINHRVDRISSSGEITIIRLIPEVFTDDMAERSIVIEISTEYYQNEFSVVYGVE